MAAIDRTHAGFAAASSIPVRCNAPSGLESTSFRLFAFGRNRPRAHQRLLHAGSRRPRAWHRAMGLRNVHASYFLACADYDHDPCNESSALWSACLSAASALRAGSSQCTASGRNRTLRRCQCAQTSCRVPDESGLQAIPDGTLSRRAGWRFLTACNSSDVGHGRPGRSGRYRAPGTMDASPPRQGESFRDAWIGTSSTRSDWGLSGHRLGRPLEYGSPACGRHRPTKRRTQGIRPGACLRGFPKHCGSTCPDPGHSAPVQMGSPAAIARMAQRMQENPANWRDTVQMVTGQRIRLFSAPSAKASCAFSTSLNLRATRTELALGKHPLHHRTVLKIKQTVYQDSNS